MNGSFSEIFRRAKESPLFPVGFQHVFGRTQRDIQECAPPIIVWSPPASEVIEAATRARGTSPNPRVLHTRRAPWEVLFWDVAQFSGALVSGDSMGKIVPSQVAPTANRHTLKFRVDASGQVGTAHFSTMLDDGPWTPQGPISALSNFEGSGIDVAFADDARDTPSFIAGSTYEFTSPSSEDHYDRAEALLEKILQTVRLQFWDGYVANPLSVEWFDEGEVTRFGMAGLVKVEFQVAVPDLENIEKSVVAFPISREMVDPVSGDAVANV